MKDDFPFIEIPEDLKAVIGDPDPGTRLYRRYGTEEDTEAWFDAICEICQGDGSVSLGGVSMFARVSRPAVHKRLKEGRLTGFLFHIVKSGMFFKDRKTLKEGGQPYGLIPVSECKAWAGEMKRRRGEIHEPARELKRSEELNRPPRGWRKKAK